MASRTHGGPGLKLLFGGGMGLQLLLQLTGVLVLQTAGLPKQQVGRGGVPRRQLAFGVDRSK